LSILISLASSMKNLVVLGWRTEGATMALELIFHRRLTRDSRPWRVAVFDGLHSAECLFPKNFDYACVS